MARSGPHAQAAMEGSNVAVRFQASLGMIDDRDSIRQPILARFRARRGTARQQWRMG